MVAPQSEFALYCCELLSSAGPCTAKRMFGGWGISTDGLTIAIIADHLVARHEGVRNQREWERSGAECMAFLQINASEVESWIDTLYARFEGVVVA